MPRPRGDPDQRAVPGRPRVLATAVPIVLVLAGRDPTGGAGVDADLEAARAAGCEARCVVTADTDQDGRSVHAVRPRDPGAWLAEARAELAGRPAAFKSGLLPGAAHVRALARFLDELPPALPKVVDPVLAASGGERFLDDEGVAALLAGVLPRGVILTPNVPEAAELAGLDAHALAASVAARVAAARELLARGAAAVVLKGGHGAEDPATDLVLARGGEPIQIERARVPGLRLHGSGCRFATGLAAGLASGLDLAAAAAAAGERVAALVRARGVPRA